ncbi:MAG: FAD-binding oxidoreductase [Nitrososphaerota archaeon]|nr:FAD-binding oxidoreductase [Nitrososphaerota archaeon]
MKQATQVAIIGAGIIGASIAYNLAIEGLNDVTVFDRSEAGSGSTSAALGGFRHQFSSELSVELSKRSIDIIHKFKELTGYDPLVHKDGYIFIASKEESLEQLRRNREMQRRLGVAVDLLSWKELSRSYPFYNFEGILGGTFCREDGHASTYAVHQGYVSKAKELRTEFYENTQVTGIEIAGRRVTGLNTTQGKISTEKVVIAAGAYSGLVGRLATVDIPIKPYPRKILVTHSFTDGIPPVIPLIIDVDSTLAVGREGKGMIMSDNQETVSSFDLVFPAGMDEKIMEKAIYRIPALANATISYANMGLYEMSPDANPIMCAIPEIQGLYCCAGFAGHGFMHSPAVGELMAELLLKKRTSLDISSFHIQRFKEMQKEKEGLII